MSTRGLQAVVIVTTWPCSVHSTSGSRHRKLLGENNDFGGSAVLRLVMSVLCRKQSPEAGVAYCENNFLSLSCLKMAAEARVGGCLGSLR